MARLPKRSEAGRQLADQLVESVKRGPIATLRPHDTPVPSVVNGIVDQVVADAEAALDREERAAIEGRPAAEQELAKLLAEDSGGLPLRESGVTPQGFAAAKPTNAPIGAELARYLATEPGDALAANGVPLFATAHAKRGGGIAPDFARIVEHVYAVDAWRDYEDLERHLEIGDGLTDYRTVATHLDGSEKRARRAHALYLAAKLELLKYETECEKLKAPMRARAVDALDDEKTRGERKKAITNDDVRAWMMERYHDELAHQEIELARLKGAVSHLERLAELLKNRCFTASTLLTTLRK